MVRAACLVRSRTLRPLSSLLEFSLPPGAGAAASMLPDTSMTRTMSQGMCATGLTGCSGGVIEMMRSILLRHGVDRDAGSVVVGSVASGAVR